MALWDDSHWIDGYAARVQNVFAGGGTAWIDFSWEPLLPHHGAGHVGWRQLVSEDAICVAEMLQVASLAMQLDRRLHLRVTNDGKITAVQTL
jgi:hypothetical protein